MISMSKRLFAFFSSVVHRLDIVDHQQNGLMQVKNSIVGIRLMRSSIVTISSNFYRVKPFGSTNIHRNMVLHGVLGILEVVLVHSSNTKKEKNHLLSIMLTSIFHLKVLVIIQFPSFFRKSVKMVIISIE